MNAVERMIYANVFAAEMMKRVEDPPRDVVVPNAPFNAWEDWETERSVEAAECAASAVERFRRIESHLRAGFGGTTVWKLYDDARARP